VVAEDIKVDMSSASKALYDIHINFREKDRLLQMPFVNNNDKCQNMHGTFQPSKYLLYKTGTDSGKQGIQQNEEGWQEWQKLLEANPDSEMVKPFAQNRLTKYTTGVSEVAEVWRETTERAPGLFHRFRHPITQTDIPILHFVENQEWEQDGKEFLQTYNYDAMEFGHEEKEPKNFFHQFCTGKLQSQIDNFAELPLWFNRNFTDFPQDIEFAYPLKTLSGDVKDNIAITPIGYSETGNPPFTITPASREILIPDGKNFWDLRRSLMQLLDTKDLFKNLDAAQNALEIWLQTRGK
jgi:hypothetical protein